MAAREKSAVKAVAKQPAKPRPTAEERKAQRQAEARQAEVKAQIARDEFELERGVVFQGLLVKALRVELLTQRYPDVRETHDWWFEKFAVDALACSFRSENWHVAQEITKETLTLDSVEPLSSGLDDALEWVSTYLEQQERLRKEAELLAQQRAEALGKLTEQDRRVLNLPSR